MFFTESDSDPRLLRIFRPTSVDLLDLQGRSPAVFRIMPVRESPLWRSGEADLGAESIPACDSRYSESVALSTAQLQHVNGETSA